MQIFGILNISPDSFSDNNAGDKILLQVQKLIDDGADIIDVGAESTNPNSKPIDSNEEIERLKPYLSDIINMAHIHGKMVSLDTYKAKTADYGIHCGVDIINDVGCFMDPNMLNVVGSSNTLYVFMHNLGIPSDKNITVPEDADIIKVLIDFYNMKVEQVVKYIPKERLIFDPGIGFGKTKQQDLQIINEAVKLKQNIDIPVLYGHSRKSFMTLFTDKPAKERDTETHEITMRLKQAGVDFVRLHSILKM